MNQATHASHASHAHHAGQSSRSLDPPEPPYEARLQAVRTAANPLLEAAMPLLRSLAEMPARLSPAGQQLLRTALDREVLRFHNLCTDAAIRHEHGVAASYALCTALDEAAASTQWGGGKHAVGPWSTDQLAVRFHGDNKGGDKVFLLLGRLAASPQSHIDLIEVFHAVLGLGFEGRYGVGNSSEGRRQLEALRHRLFILLATARGEVPIPLSPGHRGAAGGSSSRFFFGAIGSFGPLRTVPLGWTCALYLLLLAGMFAWYRVQLDARLDRVRTGIAAIGALQPSRVAAPRSPGLRALLQAEIARGEVGVEEDERHSAVSFRGDDMFLPGQAGLDARTLPLIAKVARGLSGFRGQVQISGHSDNQPIRTPAFPDNQRLSLQRAQAVADALQAGGVDAARLQVSGLGDGQPLADNRSAAGRARNRRVELVLLSY